MKKKVLSVALAMTMVFAMVGCGSAGSTEAVNTTEAADTTEVASNTDVLIPEGEESEALLKYREKGIRIGYGNDIPYEYVDDAGNFTGFEIEIIEAVCERLGITKVEPVLTSWDTYATELQQGKFDIFGAGVYVTDERLKVMNFCNLTYNLTECIVVRKDSGIESIDDLKDKAVASSVGMIYMDVTKELAEDGTFGSAIEGGQPSALALDVKTGKCDAAMMDVNMGGYLTGQDNMSDLKVLENWESKTEGLCSYLFNINNTEFVAEFNKGLDSIKEDGTMASILESYGIDPSIIIGVEEGQVELPER